MALELLAPWVLWYSNFSSEKLGKNYEEDLLELAELNTLQDFFNTFCNLQKICDLQIGDSLAFFRKGKKPLWECCPSGGCWVIRIAKKDSEKAEIFWESLIVEGVRGGFTEDVAGIMVNCKKFEVSLQVWMYEAAAAHKVVALDIKKVLKSNKLDMHLKYHKDSIEVLSHVRHSKKKIVNN